MKMYRTIKSTSIGIAMRWWPKMLCRAFLGKQLDVPDKFGSTLILGSPKVFDIKVSVAERFSQFFDHRLEFICGSLIDQADELTIRRLYAGALRQELLDHLRAETEYSSAALDEALLRQITNERSELRSKRHKIQELHQELVKRIEELLIGLSDLMFAAYREGSELPVNYRHNKDKFTMSLKCAIDRERELDELLVASAAPAMLAKSAGDKKLLRILDESDNRLLQNVEKCKKEEARSAVMTAKEELDCEVEQILSGNSNL